MKELETEFIGRGEVKGFKFKQLEGAPVYVYEVSNGSLVYYEVFKRVENSMYGTVSYPSSKSFGVWVYCVFGRDRAYSKRRLLMG